MKQLRTVLLAAALVALFALPAAADYIGNPVKGLRGQQMAVEGAMTDDTTQFIGDYALTDAGTLQARLGFWDVQGVDGDMIGVGYYHTLSDTADLDGKTVRFGVFGLHRAFSASEGGVEFDFTTTQVGGGASMSPADRLHLYGLAALELWETEATVFGPFGGKYTATDDGNNVGIAVGGEFELAERFRAGFEMQSGFENDEDQWGIFGRFAF